jgi:integrase
VVTLSGKDHYLGTWKTTASKAEYNRLIGEWLAAGRCLPASRGGFDLTVAELAAAYWTYAKGYYQKNGEPTRTLDRVKLAVRLLRTNYGPTLAHDFGPLALQAIQRDLAAGHRCRKYCNCLIDCIKRVFKWAASQELLPVTVHQALATVPGLRRGRSSARETEPIKPVENEVVEATLPHLPPIVADMVKLHRLTGCRPAEVCILRPCDVDTTGAVWSYRPSSHKSEHHGRERVIFVGPKGQDVLRPYLLREKTAYCFVPAESERKRNALKRENRQSPMTPSQSRRRPKRHPKRAPGDRYTTGSYRRSIERAVDAINRVRRDEARDATKATGVEVEPSLLPEWTPNQMRHAAATEIRKQFGLEAAQVTLGHSQADVTQIYAERDLTLAAEVMRKIG